MNQNKILQDLQSFNMHIGLANPKGENYKARLHKQQQMLDYYVTVKSIIKKLSTKRTLHLYDCGCGRSYLSFYLNYFLKNDGINNVQFICIDYNKDLIERCRDTAERLSLRNMTFYEADIANFEFPHPPDIVYSLHACDGATDAVIYQGIKENARFILSVSCCPHTLRKQMRGSVMQTVARHKPYKEQLVEMISNSLRTLLLETQGYKVTVFEFVSTTYTPKNVMLKCERVGQSDQKIEEAKKQYKKLSELFHIRPMLENYLQEQRKDE